MFQPYGKIAGISMHKGYAFVQFTNPFDARSACMGEDGRNMFSQTLDVNLVGEPKEHLIGKKQATFVKTAREWEQFYDNYSADEGCPAPRLSPPLKRPRMATPRTQRDPSPRSLVLEDLGELRSYSSPDILICGNCHDLFSNLVDFIEHRKQYCKIRFTCKCESPSSTIAGPRPSKEETAGLMCALCKENFSSSWDLMVHAQAAHMVNIYQLATNDSSQTDRSTKQTEKADIDEGHKPSNGKTTLSEHEPLMSCVDQSEDSDVMHGVPSPIDPFIERE